MKLRIGRNEREILGLFAADHCPAIDRDPHMRLEDFRQRMMARAIMQSRIDTGLSKHALDRQPLLNAHRAPREPARRSFDGPHAVEGVHSVTVLADRYTPNSEGATE